MRRKDPIYFHETEIFQNWLKEKNLEMPDDPLDRNELVNLCLREGLEEVTRRRTQEIDRLAKEAAPLLLCSEEAVKRALEQALTAPLTKEWKIRR